MRFRLASARPARALAAGAAAVTCAADLLDAVTNRAVQASPQGLDVQAAAHGTAVYELTPSGAPALGG